MATSRTLGSWHPGVLPVTGCAADLDGLEQRRLLLRARSEVRQLVRRPPPGVVAVQARLDAGHRVGHLRGHLGVVVQPDDLGLGGVDVGVGGLDERAVPPVAQPPRTRVLARRGRLRLAEQSPHAVDHGLLLRGHVGSERCLAGGHPQAQDLDAHRDVLRPDAPRHVLVLDRALSGLTHGVPSSPSPRVPTRSREPLAPALRTRGLLGADPSPGLWARSRCETMAVQAAVRALLARSPGRGQTSGWQGRRRRREPGASPRPSAHARALGGHDLSRVVHVRQADQVTELVQDHHPRDGVTGGRRDLRDAVGIEYTDPDT